MRPLQFVYTRLIRNLERRIERARITLLFGDVHPGDAFVKALSSADDWTSELTAVVRARHPLTLFHVLTLLFRVRHLEMRHRQIARSNHTDDSPSGNGSEHTTPPSGAMFFLALVLPAKNLAAELGDMEEVYNEVILPKFGKRRADIWFWAQCTKAIWPLAKAGAWRLTGAASVYEVWTRLGGK